MMNDDNDEHLKIGPSQQQRGVLMLMLILMLMLMLIPMQILMLMLLLLLLMLIPMQVLRWLYSGVKRDGVYLQHQLLKRGQVSLHVMCALLVQC